MLLIVALETTSELPRIPPTPFRSLFPSSFQATFRSTRRRRLTWNTTIRFRPIPSIDDIPDSEKSELWWSSADLQAFARQELNRLLSEGNLNASEASGSLETGTAPPTSALLLPPAKSIEVAQPSLSPAQHGTIEAQFRATTPEDVPPLADTEEERWGTPTMSSSPFGGVVSALAKCTISDESSTPHPHDVDYPRSLAPEDGADSHRIDAGSPLPPPPDQGDMFHMDVDEARVSNKEGAKRAARKAANGAASSDDDDGYESAQPVTPPTPPTPDYIRKSNREIHETQTVGRQSATRKFSCAAVVLLVVARPQLPQLTLPKCDCFASRRCRHRFAPCRMTVIRHRIISGSPPTIWTSPEGDPEKTSLIFVEDYDLILTIWTPHMDFLTTSSRHTTALYNSPLFDGLCFETCGWLMGLSTLFESFLAQSGA